MPSVALILIVVVAGCGVALVVARARRQPQPGSRVVRQTDQTILDPRTGYEAWQFSNLTSSDPAAVSPDTVYSVPAAGDACRVESNDQFNDDRERQDPPSFEVERDDGCSADSSSDGSSDSSSSD